MNKNDERDRENKATFESGARKVFEPDRVGGTRQAGNEEEKKNLEIEKVRFQENERRRDVVRYREMPVPSVQVNRVKFSKPNSDNPESAKNSPSAHLIAEAIKGEYSYGKLGLVLGLSSIIGGIVLGLNGVAGSTSWTAKLLGLESKINDAAPGVVLFIVGLFMVWATKPRVKMKDLKD
ncbi:MAG TPA: hypothetical protein VGB07_09540 [Blastocatellia bacterium]